MSVIPPAEVETTMRTGLVGKVPSCACAGTSTLASRQPARDFRRWRRGFMDLLVICLPVERKRAQPGFQAGWAPCMGASFVDFGDVTKPQYPTAGLPQAQRDERKCRRDRGGESSWL
ncbi:hypothetical protein CBM2608_U30015 [Cupriavidus taiwanensis]|nr:hypothetical protein CBM2608_U30015 [Cupriavidus taiwanensis]